MGPFPDILDKEIYRVVSIGIPIGFGVESHDLPEHNSKGIHIARFIVWET